MNKKILTPKRKLILALGLVLLLSLALVAVAAAQTGGGFDLSWHVVGSGGGTLSGGGFEVTGSVGQTAVGPTSASGERLAQGFWQDFGALVRSLLPVTMKH